MNGSVESCVTFALVCLTFAVTMCQGQSTTCHIHSRPHPSGLCGSRLSTAHQNLCFMLSIKYPQLFSSRKRSESTSALDRIYSIPLSVLAELDLTKDNWASYFFKKAYSAADQPGEKTELNHFGHESLTELSRPKANPTAELFRMLSKRSSVQKRNTGMVCDCCINVCTTLDLAAYC